MAKYADDNALRQFWKNIKDRFVPKPSESTPSGYVYTADGQGGGAYLPQSGGGSLPSGVHTGDLLVWNGAAWGAQTPSRLPVEYQEVEYIEGTGTQYIDTGFSCNNIYALEMDFQPTSLSDGISGSYYVSTNVVYSVGVGFINGQYFWSPSTSNQLREFFRGETITLDRVKMGIDILNKRLTKDGYLITDSYISKYNNNNLNFYVFCRNHYGESSEFYHSGKLYGLTFFDSFGKESLKLVPCVRKSDGEIGVYDLINKTFLTNAGTGVFLKGEDV